MKALSYIFLLTVSLLALSSCQKRIQELQANPNNPTTVPPSLVLGTVLTDISGAGSAGTLGGINSWGTVHQWNQYLCNNYDYYGNNQYSWANGSFDPYLVLKNVVLMEQEVLSRDSSKIVNPYESIGRFIRAYYYYNLTSLFGDVPLDEALAGNNNFKPAYTPQAQVFQYVLNQLDTANSHFAALMTASDNSLSATQDIYYKGDLSAWQKAVNTFKLRVLISLSNKATDGILNVPTQFANIINNPGTYPIFESQDDDLKFVYNPGGSNSYSLYPFNPSNFGSIAQRYNMADTYVSTLTTLSDPRVFVTCEPVSNLYNREFVLNGYRFDSSYIVKKDDKTDTIQCYKKTDSIAVTPKVQYDAANPAQYKLFVGASTGESLATMYPNASAGFYSFINRNRYFSNFTGEPNVLVGYKEMLFNIAEAMERGWIAGSAETYYKKGITESMSFYGLDLSKTDFTAYFLPASKNSVTDVQGYPFTFNFNDYYAQPGVALSANTDTAISEIVLQKYISVFQNSGWEAYYNWRRTGTPTFDAGSGVGNNGIIPKRWAYPVSEQTQNAANWKAALGSQKFSEDDLNQTMWLLTK